MLSNTDGGWIDLGETANTVIDYLSCVTVSESSHLFDFHVAIQVRGHGAGDAADDDQACRRYNPSKILHCLSFTAFVQ
jgi:hypothetical protein